MLIPRDRVLVGWGVGGVVADALVGPVAARRRARRPRPGRAAREPSEAELLRSFAMYAGARRGRAARDRPGAAARRPRARAGSHPRRRRAPPARCARTRRSRPSSAATSSTPPASCATTGSTAGYEPSGAPLTVVKAADSLAPGQPGARLGPLRARRAARQRRRPLLDAHRRRLRRAPRDAAAALARAAVRRAA